MPKQMPGYAAHQEKLEAARRARDAEIKKQKEAEEKAKEKAKKEAEKLRKGIAELEAKNKKLNIVSEVSGLNSDLAFELKQLHYKSPFLNFLTGFFITQMLAFITGSTVYLAGDGRTSDDYGFYEHTGIIDSDDIYGDISYGQAIKNAYLFDDWRHGKGGVGQAVAGMFSVLIAIGVGAVMADAARKSNKEKDKTKRQLIQEKSAKSEKILKQLEELKKYGIDAPKLIKDLTPSIKKVLESLSEIDRGYFDNLATGGLDKVNYETCVAIISGYLKSHPEEYNKIIGIIDEATLPPEIVKKYGKGNTISFAAAQALVPEK